MTKKTTLIIQDEVNCRFVSIDPETRRKIVEALKFFNPKARHTASYKLGRWDGKIGFATVGGGTYVNLLDRVLPIVIGAGYEIEIDDRRKPFDNLLEHIDSNYFAHINWPKGHQIAGQPIILNDHQVEAINTYVDNPQSIQSISTGAGKAQPLDSLIKIPGGWKRMGDVSIGDDIVVPDGSVSKIVGVYPQGLKDVYKISFKDGRVVEACGEHLWKAYCVDWKQCKARGYSNWKILNTVYMAKQLQNSKRPLSIPLISPEIVPDHDFVIAPYMLGALIGDGGLGTQGRVVFISADTEIIEKINSMMDDDYELRHSQKYDYHIHIKKDRYSSVQSEHRRIGNIGAWHKYVKIIEDLGLDCCSLTKFIPSEYLEKSSFEQKLEVIRGLMDTDGTVGKNGHIEFSTSSPQLAEDFQYLIRSIGGVARCTSRIPKYTHNGEKREGNRAYRIIVRYRDPTQLFSLQRKLNKVPKNYQYAESLKLQITSIEHVGQKECQCIMVDHPDHLYITNDFVTTHNTVICAALSSMCEKMGRTIVIVPSKSLVVQTEADYKNVGVSSVGVLYGDRKEIDKKHVICTWQSLSAVAKKLKVGEKPSVDAVALLKDVVAVITDEAHCAKATLLKELLFGTFGSACIRWGMTGTIPPLEFEQITLLAGIGPVVGEIKAKKLQDLGILAKCHVNVLQLNDKVPNFEFYKDEINYTVKNKKRLSWISNFCNQLSETGNTVVLVDKIDTGKMMNAMIPNSVFLSGKSTVNKRLEEYNKINTSDNKLIIATYGIAAVGINLPRIFNLVLLEAGVSPVRCIQAMGRGLRIAEDKDSVQIFDICSTLKFSAKHLSKRKSMYKLSEYPFTIDKVDLD